MTPEAQQQLMSVLSKALGGAALGAGALGGATYLGGDSEDPERGNKALRAALLGAGMGGLGGAGWGAMGKMTPEAKKHVFSPGWEWWRSFTGNPLAGGTIGGGIGAGLDLRKHNLLQKMWAGGKDKLTNPKELYFPREADTPAVGPTTKEVIDPKTGLKVTVKTPGSPKIPGELDQAAQMKLNIPNYVAAGKGLVNRALGQSGITNPTVLDQLRRTYQSQKASIPAGVSAADAMAGLAGSHKALQEVPITEKLKGLPSSLMRQAKRLPLVGSRIPGAGMGMFNYQPQTALDLITRNAELPTSHRFPGVKGTVMGAGIGAGGSALADKWMGRKEEEILKFMGPEWTR